MSIGMARKRELEDEVQVRQMRIESVISYKYLGTVVISSKSTEKEIKVYWQAQGVCILWDQL